MAIFKDKTGRGEVNYAQGPVQGQAGTVLVLNDLSGRAQNVFAPSAITHTVFQLRGESNGVTDMSSNSFAVTETSLLTKRIEDVNHRTRLKTFEFTAGQSLSLSASLDPGRHKEFFAIGGASPISNYHRLDTHTTILPYQGNQSNYGGGGHEAIISGWIYIDSYNTAGTNGGSCIMESVSGTSRGFGVVLSSTGELAFRVYDWGADSTLSNSSTRDFQQIKTRKKLSLRNWHHFTIFFYGFKDYQYAPNGLDEPRTPTSADPPIADIFINGIRQLNPSESGKTSGTFSGAIANADLPIVLGTGLGGYDEDATNKQFTTDAQFYGRLAEVNYFLTMNLGDIAEGINANLGRPAGFHRTYRETIARALFTGNRQPASGITNVSERLLLRDLDQASTHPTAKRSGDQRRLGNHTLIFDDTRTQTLRGSTVHYPSKLVPGDALAGTIYNGYFHGDLTTQHTASTDSYDTFYRRADQPAHVPFVESRIYIDDNSSFYLTGTRETIIPGFDKPLKQKSNFVINLSPTSETEFGYTGSLNHGYQGLGSVDNFGDELYVVGFNNSSAPSGNDIYVPTGSLMVYWNNSSRVFEKKGRIVSQKAEYLKGRNVGTGDVGTAPAPQNILADYRDRLCTGFSRHGGYESFFLSGSNGGGHSIGNGGTGVYKTVNNDTAVLENTGRPISTWGFPFAQKYEHPTGDTVKMSEYITEPFLLEKIVYEFSASFDTATQTNRNNGHNSTATIFGGISPSNGPSHQFPEYGVAQHHYSFFVLRQFFNKQSSITKDLPVFARNTVVNGFSPDVSAIGFAPKVSQTFTGSDRSRELIGYGQVYISFEHGPGSSFYSEQEFNYLVENGFGREVNIRKTGLTSGQPSVTGSFRMEFSPTVTPQYDRSAPEEIVYPANTSEGISRSTIFDYYVGGRGNPFDVETRNIAKSVLGRDPTLQGQIYEAISTSAKPSGQSVDITTPKTSPYILMPEDELIFGWNAPTILKDGFSGINSRRNVMSILPGNGKVTFFGSFLKNSQPKQFQLNQLLNNDIVHEAIGQESIHDQFDIEPRGAFSGSYADEVISGSFTAPYNGFDAISQTTVNLARRVGGRSSEGTLGVTGSLRRSLPLVSDNKTEYDSFLIDLESAFKSEERSTGIGTSYFNDYSLAGNDLVMDFPIVTDDPTQEGIDGTIANINFRTAYIFNRYNSISRVRANQTLAQNNLGYLVFTSSNLITDGFVAGSLAVNPNSPSVYTNAAGLARLDTSFNERDGRLEPLAPPASGLYPVSTNLGINKFLFGLGEGPLSAHYYRKETTVGQAVQPYDIRGFKYGLSNVADKKPKNVFRRDRYGQIRDMLEMAPNTAYIDDKTNLVSYPIEAQFFDSDGSLISPEATSCSNLSTNLTSSAPFFDRDVVEFSDSLVIRNRGPLNNKVVDLTIEI